MLAAFLGGDLVYEEVGLKHHWSSGEILRVIESFGLTGTWSWVFEDQEQRWSPGLHRILGVPTEIPGTYELFCSLIHPEDRHLCPPPSELVRSGILNDNKFRIIRPDQTLRTILCRADIMYAPDGRPISAVGFVIDVSDREMLIRVQSEEKRRKRLIFEHLKAFTSVTYAYPYTGFSDEYVELVGLPKEELLEEATRPVVRAERQRWREIGREKYLSGEVVQTTPHIVLANRDIVQYRFVMVPKLGPDGKPVEWANYVAPLGLQGPVPQEFVEFLDQLVGSSHLRAARALLDWSMHDAAVVSGLSMSTIRRLEEGGGTPDSRSKAKYMESLRRCRVRFSLLDNATVAVSTY